MLQHNDSRNPRDQESTERSMPSIPQRAEDGRDAETDEDRDPLDVSILPADELVFLKVGDVVNEDDATSENVSTTESKAPVSYVVDDSNPG